MSLRERLGLEHAIVGAGLGGGLSRARLSVVIAEAGGLGQLGIMPAPLLRSELAAHRERSARPVALNLLLPFARRGHWELAREADAVVTFWGRPRRVTGGIWVHQCGSEREAKAPADAGADGVVVQGVEAGGHVRGSMPRGRARRRLIDPSTPSRQANGYASSAVSREKRKFARLPETPSASRPRRGCRGSGSSRPLLDDVQSRSNHVGHKRGGDGRVVAGGWRK